MQELRILSGYIWESFKEEVMMKLDLRLCQAEEEAGGVRRTFLEEEIARAH